MGEKRINRQVRQESLNEKNPKSQIPNHKFQNPNPKSQSQNSKFKIQNFKSQIAKPISAKLPPVSFLLSPVSFSQPQPLSWSWKNKPPNEKNLKFQIPNPKSQIPMSCPKIVDRLIGHINALRGAVTQRHVRPVLIVYFH